MPRLYKNGARATETPPIAVERRGASGHPALPQHHYQLYGLKLASQLELPELAPSADLPPADIEIRTTTVPATLPNATISQSWMQLSSDTCDLHVDAVARLRVEHGRSILVDRRMAALPSSPCTAAIPGDVRLFILGSAMGALIHQRGWLPLHLSALNTPGGVWGFTGPSGAGKSTLAAWLHYHHEWPLISDDVAVVRPGEAQAYLYPGPPRLKLWDDALEALGISTQGLARDLSRIRKYQLVRHQGFQAKALPMKGLVLLSCAEDDEPATLEPIHGIAAFQAVLATLYRPELVPLPEASERLFRDASQLASRLRIYRFRRPKALDKMALHLRPLIEQIRRDADDAA
ncbi:hypothetical protein [Billgrantia kenyensis]|uniref:Hpr(Ser) kinase/phosphatase n=1 Tax=Billgrantia kenyensis TaxID=321266 RepID=A0A7V9W3D5_9GAMM|nr:hypothetical protein [Halomonas kenyensis]MBA2780239.1 hypothetical protein [Halomonas kenyensis]MCG6663105.1 hypothetical protein [Halomonas kenyensis]